MPNPDAITFNEYQLTNRATVGVLARLKLTDQQDFTSSVFYRRTWWTESVPSSIDRRELDRPGFILQYDNNAIATDWLKNHFSVGLDFDWQQIAEKRYDNVNAGQAGDQLFADQRIRQSGVGLFLLDRIELGPDFGLLADGRYDWIGSSLADNLRQSGVNLSGDADFGQFSGRVGGSWAPLRSLSIYANWGQGFLPPATEELANNPDAMGGFNRNLVPATSQGEEVGGRGTLFTELVWDLALFHLSTVHDFYRYRVESRPLETFYRNAGSTERWGVEAALAWFPFSGMTVRGAYTFADYRYRKMQTQTATYKDTFVPNSPQHQASADVEYRWRGFLVGFAADYSGRWYIDPSNTVSTHRFLLLAPRAGYIWRGADYRWELVASIRNAFGTKYVAFTEPDPDGNSYQPGPTAEGFVSVRIWLGEEAEAGAR